MLLGPLGDKFGARKTFSCCLILSGLSMVSYTSNIVSIFKIANRKCAKLVVNQNILFPATFLKKKKQLSL